MESISEFKDALKEDMESLFGSCEIKGGVLRSMGEHFGVSDSGVIIEAALESGLSPDDSYPIVHFHTTLAQKIDDSLIPVILQGLNDLNTVIAAGSFPAFGSFGYYAPLRQVYLTYRMPLDPGTLDAGRENARYYMGSLYEQLDLFVDYVLFLCNDPDRITLDEYMEYLDTIADFNDLENRLELLEEYIAKNLEQAQPQEE